MYLLFMDLSVSLFIDTLLFLTHHFILKRRLLIQMAATKDLPETSDVDVFWEKVHFIKRPGCDEPS